MPYTPSTLGTTTVWDDWQPLEIKPPNTTSALSSTVAQQPERALGDYPVEATASTGLVAANAWYWTDDGKVELVALSAASPYIQANATCSHAFEVEPLRAGLSSIPIKHLDEIIFIGVCAPPGRTPKLSLK